MGKLRNLTGMGHGARDCFTFAALAAMWFFALLLVSNQPANASQNLPTAVFGSILGDDTSTRLFVDFDSRVEVRSSYRLNPDRIVIETSSVNFDFSSDSQMSPRGLVAKISFGRMSEERSRIVIELRKPAEILKSSIAQRIDEESFRFVLDLDAVDNQRFAALVSANSNESEATDQSGEKKDTAEKPRNPNSILVLLDPGHGGIDGGAVGTRGTVEKDLVLKFANVLRAKLLATGKYDVRMTREDDHFVSLRERVEQGRRLEADLFISIHADSLRQRSVRGSTIYTLSNRASDRLSEELANSENSADLVAGLSMPEDTAAVTDILADLTTRETRNFSRGFSKLLREELGQDIRLIKNPERYAAFGVLKAPEVPGVLLELGYLSNRDDEKLLTDSEWQEKAARAVARAIGRYFDKALQ